MGFREPLQVKFMWIYEDVYRVEEKANSSYYSVSSHGVLVGEPNRITFLSNIL